MHKKNPNSIQWNRRAAGHVTKQPKYICRCNFRIGKLSTQHMKNSTIRCVFDTEEKIISTTFVWMIRSERRIPYESSTANVQSPVH